MHAKVFDKMFVLRPGWSLPNASVMYTEPEWKLNEFQTQKTFLNLSKQKLNDFNLDEWHVHTGKMNPAGMVVNYVRRLVRPDFLTQAWCKFYEIASSSDLVPLDKIHKEGGTSLTSVHLCEAPGAFISALNHFLAINHEKIRLDWMAMTLNPHHEGNGHPDIVTDDRLILHTLDNWEFGPDYTGDIFQPGYSEHLYRRVLDRFDGKGAWLVTADGSVDCSDDPGEQESIVSRLQDHETMVALSVLRDGGSLVLKAFTVFECNTICRIFLLCSVFRSVVLRKPATSKPGNSEVYVVCKGYWGRSMALPYIQAFYASHQQPNLNGAMFPLSSVPVVFTQQLLKCSEYFSNLQVETINSNVELLPFKEDIYQGMKQKQVIICREFVSRLGLRSIRSNQELTSISNNNSGNRHNWEHVRINRKPPGLSYAEKTRIRYMDVAQEAGALYLEVTEFHEWRMTQRHMDDVVWYMTERLIIRTPDTVGFLMGKPVTAVKGSKFCSEALIHYRHRVLSKFSRVGGRCTVDSACRASYYRAKIDRPHAVVCDLTDFCNKHGSDNTALQHRCLTAIVDALRDLSDGDDLVIVGYPLYTQIAVANVYAVANMFDRYGLFKPDHLYGHAVAFLKLNSTLHGDWLAVLKNAIQHLLPGDFEGMALVSYMPIKTLLEEESYADLLTVNDLCIVHEIEPILLDSSTVSS